MRNLFLALLLANLLLLAWQWWIEPSSPPEALPVEGPQLDLEGKPAGGAAGMAQAAAGTGTPGAAADRRPDLPAASGSDPVPEGIPPPDQGPCLRVGPMPDGTSARLAATALAGQGYLVEVQEKPGETWLGHWVQITGFSTSGQAESARRRLMAGGLVDAYLMEEGPSTLVSLGVFRDRARAERVLAAAQSLGFSPVIRDRVRPTVEPWVLVRLAPGQKAPAIPDLGLSGAWIVRSEATACPATEPPASAGSPVVP